MGKKGLKMNGTTMIRRKRGSQWNTSQIRVSSIPWLFFTFVELYSDMNNTAVLKGPKS
jgi:hypothetical protein